MNMENHQTKFNHEDWLEQISQFIDTSRQFCNELLRGLKTLSKKSLLEAWKDIRSAISRLTPQDFIVTGLLTFTGMFGVMIFMVGFSLFGYQAILWLQDGVWTEFPLFVVFDFLFENTVLQAWMTHPESWVGLQKMFSWFLESVPLSIALMVPGISIALLMAGTLAMALLFRFYQLKNRHD
ncbi:MAG: hypothetical protein HOF21_12325 [Nitrospina sp.]|jgi:hypothetical protein|nr:hypothetical protein [Nitrospina sp.]